MDSRGRLKGTVYVLVCVALWGLIPVVARFGQSELDNHQFLFWSSLVSFAVLAANAGVSGQLGELRQYSVGEWAFFLFLGLLGTYIYYLFLYLGYARASGLEVLVVQYTWPIIIVALSLLLLGERLDWRKSLSLLLGFIGVVVVLTRGEPGRIDVSQPGVILLVFAGAFCFALFSVLSKRVERNPQAVVSIYFLAALVASFVSMHYFSGFALPRRADLWPILLNGVLVNGYSYIFWVRGLQSADASYLAPFTYIAPVLSAFYLVVIFDEPLLPAYGIGLACILAGGLLNTLGGRRLTWAR